MPCVVKLRKNSTSGFVECKNPASAGFPSTNPRSTKVVTPLRGVTLVGGLLRIDAHLEPRAVLVLELHDAVDKRVDREIRAETDVAARMPLRSALADDDVPGDDFLSTELLYAAILWIAVAAVSGRADALFMCHENSLYPSLMSLMRTSVKPWRCPCFFA